jgi:CRP-like cAMP-binding protein
VQGDGGALRIESVLLRQVLIETPQLERMLHRYAYAQAMQVAQASACNCLHQVSERLARWLAITCDRTESALLPLTQEFLAKMLGCRRASVTSAIGMLQRAGVLRSEHGQVRILDRKRLERETRTIQRGQESRFCGALFRLLRNSMRSKPVHYTISLANE